MPLSLGFPAENLLPEKSMYATMGNLLQKYEATMLMIAVR
jgi:hypothetical protein